MTQKFASLAAALVCAALSSPVFATTSASASLDTFSFTLVDLQFDFNSPSFGWIADDSQPQFVITRAENGNFADGEYTVGRSGLFSPVSTSATLSNGLAHANAVVGGDGNFENYSLNVSGDVTGAADVTNEFGTAAYMDYGLHYALGNFVLGPQTQVTFNALSSVSLNADFAAGGYADAGTSLYVTYGDQSFSDGVSACSEPANPETNPAGCDLVGHELSSSRLLTVSLSNPTNAPIIGRFYAGASAHGVAMASAVPEPASYGLFVSGLTVLGLALRRRRGTENSARQI